ncbi:MAG: type II toxin-antitoxin system VapC family toxin [Candidatus Helarchaeota archaeon]
MKISLDTNIFIAIKNREKGFQYCERILDAIDDGSIECVESTIILAEVLVGFYKNKEKREAEKFMNHFMQVYQVIPVVADISREAARIRSENNIKLPDAIIIATVKSADALYLITNDNRVYNLEEIQVMTPREFVEKHLE